MTLPAIVNTAHSLSYYTLLQNVTANNLANATTDGFKADRLAAQSVNNNAVPVEGIDLSQGNLQDTGRTFDVALQGAGFLLVNTPAGARLIRGGSLQENNQGFLTDQNGNLVDGVKGPIPVSGNRVEIQPDGTVVVDGATTGQLRIVTVANPQQLTREGEGRFATTQPLIDANNVGVHQGALEDSNVSALMGTVDLITIQRNYATSVEALKAMDGVLGTVTSDIGRPAQ